MTVTVTSVILSDSVRHASSVLLFIWKRFNVSELCAVDTSGGSFLCCDSGFAGANTLISHDYKTHCKVHLSSGNIVKVLNLCDLQKQAARGVVSVSQRQTSSYHLNCGDWSSDNLDSEFGTACIQNMKQQQRDCVKVWRWISLLIRYVHWGLYCSCGWLTSLIFQVPKNWGRYVAKRLNQLKRKSELQLFQGF